MAPENFDDPVYIVNPQSRFFFTMVDQTTRRHAFQVFTAFHLERHFHNEILEIHAIRDSASPRHLELFSNKVKTEKHNVAKLR